MTTKQKQNLLAYLGYYTGGIDGKWGPKSAAAARAFQEDFGITVDGIVGPETEKALKHAVAYGMPEEEEPGGADPADGGSDSGPVETDSAFAGTFWDHIQHFERSEFKCKCGKYCDGFPTEMNETVVTVADRAREHFGAPAHVISGVRCKTHNANAGGVADSRHMAGKAIDLKIDGVSAAQLLVYVQAQPEIRYAYAIDGTNVHFDVI